MFKANVDTPWAVDPNGANTPQLSIDPAFAGLILGWTDVTGKEGAVVDVGGGQNKHLYGGNYAKITGIQPDYLSGRLGGSGDPDWLTIEIKVELEQTLIDIDAVQDYYVYATEEIIEAA